MQSYKKEKLILKPHDMYKPLKKQIAVLEKDRKTIKSKLYELVNAFSGNDFTIINDIYNSGFGLHLGKRLCNKYHIYLSKDAKFIYRMIKNHSQHVHYVSDYDVEDNITVNALDNYKYVDFTVHPELYSNAARGSVHDVYGWLQNKKSGKFHLVIYFKATLITDINALLNLINDQIRHLKADAHACSPKQSKFDFSYQALQAKLLAGQAQNYLNNTDAMKKIDNYVEKKLPKMYDKDTTLGQAVLGNDIMGAHLLYSMDAKHGRPKNDLYKQIAENIYSVFKSEVKENDDEKTTQKDEEWAYRHHLI